jgi:hypothetical protein
LDLEDGNKPQTEKFKGKSVANSCESGIINYARVNDVFLFDEDDIPPTATVKPEDILKNLETSDIGKDTIEYLEKEGITPCLIYEKQYHSNRGDQIGRVINIYMDNIKNDRVAAQTIIHEVTHYRYGIGQCQWAEAVCMAKEKMHIVNRNKLTGDELRYIVKLARDNYPEYAWKKGGYKNGEKI